MTNVVDFHKLQLEEEASRIAKKLDCDVVAILTFKRGQDDNFPYPATTHWYTTNKEMVDLKVAISALLRVIDDLNWRRNEKLE